MMTTFDSQLSQHFGNLYAGHPLTLQAISEGQWLFVLQAPPQCRLRLSAESDLTRKLDQMGFADEVKVGHTQLDDLYVIRAESPESQALIARPEIQALVHELSPFVELELTHKEYRLIQEVARPEVERFEKTLETLRRLVQASLAEGSAD